MATINLNVTPNDVVSINVCGAEANPTEEELDDLYYKLKKALCKRAKDTDTNFWYEVWIDLDEDFDETIYPLIKNMPFDAQVDFCWGFLCRCDNYYFSDEWKEDWNKWLRDNLK